MFVMQSYIELGRFKFEHVASVESVSTWQQFTDTASVKFARSYRKETKPVRLDEQIKRGDTALVKLGYDNRLNTVLEGYIVGVKPNIPVEALLEDKMYELKTKAVQPKQFKNAALTDVLAHIGIDKYKLLGETTIGKFSIEPDLKNAAQVLERWKRETGQPAFYRNGILVIGKPYDPETATKHRLVFGRNIISHDLEYRKASEVFLKVTAISNNIDGTKTEVVIGDEQGEQRTLNAFNMTEKELRAFAENEISRLKYDGWRGKATIFGEPFIQHGDIVELVDEDNGEKNGNYYIDVVKRNFDTSGYKQEITIGSKAA